MKQPAEGMSDSVAKTGNRGLLFLCILFLCGMVEFLFSQAQAVGREQKNKTDLSVYSNDTGIQRYVLFLDCECVCICYKVFIPR